MRCEALSLMAIVLVNTLVLAQQAEASPILYVHDVSGQLGTVDVATGQSTVIGDMGVTLTDIAFSPDGVLYGVTFTDLYHVNPATAATTLIGAHGVNNANALTFGSDGSLLAASDTDPLLFSIDPSTGATTLLGNMGHRSRGDLAVLDGRLYLASRTGQLVRIRPEGPPDASVVGPHGFAVTFGLVAIGDTLFGLAGTRVFVIDTTTGAGTQIVDYGGQGFGPVWGAAVRPNLVPEAGFPGLAARRSHPRGYLCSRPGSLAVLG